ncbi:hypothetical protein MYX76_15915 [Desulfobacterota bacterium AH_259_B03_O07]|nr:hypothetical protein [Desulfobacterota bacterium AH_259_B03_O07]
MDDKLVDEIIGAYGKVLQQNPKVVYPSESELPYTKDQIRRAISIKLLKDLDLEMKYRNTLESAYLLLENYLPPQEFDRVNEYQTLMLSLEPSLDKTASEEDKGAIWKMRNKIVNLHNSYTEITKVVSERMDERMKDIQSIRRIIGLSEE